VFVQQRLFADSAHHIFYIVNTRDFLSHGRVADSLVQFYLTPAVLLAKAGCSVEAVTYAYSLAIPLAACAIFLFIYFFNGDLLCALALAMALVVDETGNFFFPTILRMLSCVIVLLCSAFFYITTQDASTPWLKVKKVINYIVFFFCIYSCTYHQTATICVLFTLGVLLLSHWRISWLVMSGAALVFIMLALKFLFPSPYEEGILSRFTLKHWDLIYIGKLSLFLGRYYWATLLGVVFAVTVLILRKRYVLSTFVILSIVGFLFILNCMFQVTRNSFPYYHYAVCLIPMFAIVPFIAVMRETTAKWRYMAYTVACVLVVWGLAAITLSHGFYTKRVDYFKRVLVSGAAQQGDAFIFNKGHCPVQLGIPYHMDKETLILSALMGQRPAKTIAFSEKRKPPAGPLAAAPWLNDPSGGYRLLNTPGSLEQLGPEARKKVSLKILLDSNKLPANTELYPFVQITNRNDEPIHSAGAWPPYRIRIAYHWFKGDECVVWDGINTPLEVDVYEQYTQPFTLRTPERPGQYRLVVDLVLVAHTWFRMNESVHVEVYE